MILNPFIFYNNGQISIGRAVFRRHLTTQKIGKVREGEEHYLGPFPREQGPVQGCSHQLLSTSALATEWLKLDSSTCFPNPSAWCSEESPALCETDLPAPLQIFPPQPRPGSQRKALSLGSPRARNLPSRPGSTPLNPTLPHVTLGHSHL